MSRAGTTTSNSEPGSSANPDQGDGLRVLLCTDHLPPSDGGVEHVVEQLARRLASRGFSVGVYTLRSADEQLDITEHREVSLFTSGKIDLTQYIGLQSSFSVGAFADFRRILTAFDPDIVHVHNRFFLTSYVAWLYRYLANYSLVTTLHLGNIDHIDGVAGTMARSFQSIFPSQLISQSESVICVSQAVADVARSLGANRITVAPNAVDADRFNFDENGFEKRVLYVGRLVRNNGPQTLIRAIPDIIDQHPDAKFDIVGSGELKPELEKLVESVSAAEAVTIHGFVEDIVQMYSTSDIFCRPSYSEGLPLTLLESMSTGTVPVVTPVAGTKEVLTDGETGHFVDIDDPKATADTISRLLDRPEKLRQMAEAGRKHVERNHSWEQRVDTIAREYRRVVENE